MMDLPDWENFDGVVGVVGVVGKQFLIVLINLRIIRIIIITNQSCGFQMGKVSKCHVCDSCLCTGVAVVMYGPNSYLDPH